MTMCKHIGAIYCAFIDGRSAAAVERDRLCVSFNGAAGTDTELHLLQRHPVE